ncbi:hypothetical protein O6H91_06G011900 [Diphasiastrum complanatum]|uniref:Uncharacterized protein n=1 Tax=Diphasiastrum complanatum TaxID=34168 RepID=A0ACC2DAN5_DIPCM|nr:hypothetical protein O6H91_06G011900 [Diphasiastrum complanatum]
MARNQRSAAIVLLQSLILMYELDFSAAQRCSATNLCSEGLCCGQHGYCGSTDVYCGSGCLIQCSNSTQAPASTPSSGPGPAPFAQTSFDAVRKGKGFIAVYWGQGDKEGSLADACNTGNYGVIIMAFLNNFGGGQSPGLDLAGHCDPPSGGCTTLSTDIHTCQQKGVKILLSLGGADGQYGMGSQKEADSLAQYLWHNFLGGTSSHRPLGEAVLDGIDFDIEKGNGLQSYAQLAQSIRKLTKGKSKHYYLSAAPQCLFPDAYVGPGKGLALQTGLFDYVWVQFYNNPPCNFNPNANRDQSSGLAAWNKWVQHTPAEKIFLGLLVSPSATDNGFIPSDVLISSILPHIRSSSKYGGVMFWDFSGDNGYSSSIKSSL